jgi:membrane protease YdiL (CAAX protease family)
MSAPPPADVLRLSIAGLLGFQIGLIVLTLLASGMLKSNRLATLALRPPRDGWRVLPLALIPLFVVTGVWTGLLAWLQPETVAGDLRPFQQLLTAGGIVMLFVIGVGAPLSEELLFRGFLFSGLAKSRLGLVGTSILTTLLWTIMHWGYSVFGLIEVLAIGLYFSWLLIRTGSLWTTIFCHAVYNSVVGLALYFVTLPSA